MSDMNEKGHPAQTTNGAEDIKEKFERSSIAPPPVTDNIVTRDGFRLHPQPTTDPLDPLNWTFFQKHTILGIVMLMCTFYHLYLVRTMADYSRLHVHLCRSLSKSMPFNWLYWRYVLPVVTDTVTIPVFTSTFPDKLIDHNDYSTEFPGPSGTIWYLLLAGQLDSGHSSSGSRGRPFDMELVIRHLWKAHHLHYWNINGYISSPTILPDLLT